MRYIFALLFVLVSAHISQATTYYYVDPSAGSNGTGTINSPWNTLDQLENAGTISAIETSAQMDDVVIYVKRGTTYQISGTNRLYLSFKGTENHWVTIDGDTWGTGGRAQIYLYNMSNYYSLWIQNGTGAHTADGVHAEMYLKMTGFEVYSNNTVDGGIGIITTFNASHVWIDNCVIHGTKNNGSHGYGIKFSTPDDNTEIEISDLMVTNCTVYDIATSGIAVYPFNNLDGPPYTSGDAAANVIYKGNTVYDFGKRPASTFGAGLTGMSVRNAKVLLNTVYNGSGNTDGPGIKFEQRYKRCENLIVERNLIYGGSGIELYYGVELQGADSTVVRNNVIYNLSGDGIKLTEDSTAIDIINNTIVNQGHHGVNNNSGTVANLKNNIFYQVSDYKAIYNPGTIQAHGNNLFYNTVNTRTCYDNGGGTTYTYAGITSWEPSAQNSDPMFEDTGSLPTVAGSISGLAITAAGEAYHNGATLNCFGNDFEGETRLIPWDIGAWEYQD